MTDEAAMRRAIDLGMRGHTAPNPLVGCVIVRGGQVVGEGFHAYAGAPHAEVVALAEARDLARGASVYVTLEPCDHHGRTPPCTDALLKAGVARVVFAVPDPTSEAGGGGARLAAAGIAVEQGLLREEAEEMNRVWLFAQRGEYPYVTLKIALSLDGKIDDSAGEGRALTGELARRETHRLRAVHGAVMVGAGTILADDPLLTVRTAPVAQQPIRVLFDSDGLLSPSARVFDGAAPVYHVREADPEAIFRHVREMGAPGVLVEGGAQTHQWLLEYWSAEELVIFVAPLFLGPGKRWIELGREIESRYTLVEARALGSDALLRYRLQG